MDRQSSSTRRMERPFRFLPEEVKEMEERLFPVTSCRLDHILMDELAVKFSYFRGLAGMTPVKSKQVLNWFHNNRNKHCPKIAREAHAPGIIISMITPSMKLSQLEMALGSMSKTSWLKGFANQGGNPGAKRSKLVCDIGCFGTRVTLR
ncbi:unnamed protein product [Miscanthus lutarioriparius]|uniref:Homeobox domain-containing protein n=1 Tax=Miscanthus lutarioriparius TaxID=422564 RepID=A0A811QEX8_9POAL|nr:unnamed protein product [Miscanthus lutarioriparius]